MKIYEIEEVNEIRQVLEDALQRADKAFQCFNSKRLKDEGFNHLAQSVKSMTHVRQRLKDLAELRLAKQKSNSGAYP